MKTCLLIFALSAASLAASASVSVAVQDQSGFKDAVQLGDAHKLEQLLDETSDAKVKLLLRAGLSRIGGNFAESSRLAQQCYEPDQVATTGSRSMFCGLLLAGNALADGDVAAWARTSHDIQRKTEPMYKDLLASMQQAAGKDAAKIKYVIDLFATVDDYAPFEHWPYQTTIKRTDRTGDSLPLVWHGAVVDGRSSRLPFVTIEINDQPVEVLVDTGTNDNLLLSVADAKRLGIAHLTAGWQEVMHLGGAHEPSMLGDAGSVQIGGTGFHHLPVVVSGSQPPIMGLNLLRQLGAVSLSASAMTVAPAEAAGCSEPLALSSLISGGHSALLYPIKAGSTPVQAVLDTGAPMLVYEMRDSLPDTAAPATSEHGGAPGTPDIAHASARGDFSIGGIEHHHIGYPIFKRFGVFNFALGAWLLRNNHVVMDFERSHLCVVRQAKATDEEAKN